MLGGFPFRRGLLAKRFHAVRLLEPVPAALDRAPAGRRAFYLNHPGWWDPLAAVALAEHLAPDRVPYGPIDANSMRKTPLLGRLGMFPVERDAAAGAKAFLTTARAILDAPAADLWLTPEGTFASPEVRPLRFAPGLGHLLARDPHLTCIPVAVRYDFWTDRRPELLLAVGEPVRRADVAGAASVEEPTTPPGGGVRSEEARRTATGGTPPPAPRSAPDSWNGGWRSS